MAQFGGITVVRTSQFSLQTLISQPPYIGVKSVLLTNDCEKGDEMMLQIYLALNVCCAVG